VKIGSLSKDIIRRIKQVHTVSNCTETGSTERNNYAIYEIMKHDGKNAGS